MDELVQVMVPRSSLTPVYALIAELEAEEKVNGNQQEIKIEDNGQSGEEWTRDLIRRMYEESPPGMIRALNHLADCPDLWVTASELTEAIEPGRDSHRLGGTLGAFGRRVKNRYGMNTWPFEAKWDHEAHHVNYRMPGWVAEQVLEHKRDG